MSKKYGILGFGLRTGLGLLQYLQDADIDIFDGGDLQAIQTLVTTYKKPGQHVQVFADDVACLKKNIGTLLISPGVPAEHPIIAQAHAWGITVQTEIDFSFDRLQCPVLAITGSLGKSTMAKMSFDLLCMRYKNVFLGGNYGTALVQALGKGCDHAVVEVSSFQLQQSTSFHPKVAVFLNLYANHLDRHGSMDHYLYAKQRIFQNQSKDDYAIVSADQPELIPLGCEAKILTFSTQADQRADAYVKDESIYLFGREITLDFHGHPKQQVLALLLLACIYKIDIQKVKEVLAHFVQLEHRQEKIVKGDNVFVNDSKSTTPDATLFALTQFQAPVHLMMGGKGKGLDLQDFAQRLQQYENIVSITVFGEMAPTLGKVLSHPNLVQVKNLDQAFTSSYCA
ncbi:MAG: UDP-N-acetylmuramoyl-L-alanine--D-glutamate ligase [Bdellovibrionota bacterium]